MQSVVLSLLLILITIENVYSQHRFRSILIERACQRRKDLDFCNEDKEPQVAPIPELIIPPAIDQSKATSHSIQKASSTTEAPNDEVEFKRSDSDKEVAGSLVKLPKPNTDQTSISTLKEHPNGTHSIEDEKGVLVFVSEFCVLEREHFVKKCHGTIEKDDVEFCKAYPAACTSTSGVLPVVSYCQRYYKHYPKFCTKDPIPKTVIQFCYAFESFCLPELTPAKPKPTAQPALRRCEDVLTEARKICNPFPHPKDTFNVVRCTNFLVNCKKYVDWS